MRGAFVATKQSLLKWLILLDKLTPLNRRLLRGVYAEPVEALATTYSVQSLKHSPFMAKKDTALHATLGGWIRSYAERKEKLFCRHHGSVQTRICPAFSSGETNTLPSFVNRALTSGYQWFPFSFKIVSEVLVVRLLTFMIREPDEPFGPYSIVRTNKYSPSGEMAKPFRS